MVESAVSPGSSQCAGHGFLLASRTRWLVSAQSDLFDRRIQLSISFEQEAASVANTSGILAAADRLLHRSGSSFRIALL